MTIPAAPPLALYVHLPWCVRKCPYCDFNSHRAGDDPPRGDYLAALIRDLDEEAERAAGRGIVSVFIGGGTPSLFSGEEIGRLLEAADARLNLVADVEITMEANPGTVERGRFGEYRSAGVNRLSLGAQSFADPALAALGRIHGAADTLRAFSEARDAGFDNINLDLMFALPAQTLEGALRDVETAIGLDPEHVSHYQLTLEPNTVFHHSPPPLPDADLAWQMQEACHARLAAGGYRQYEVSAFALPGRQCRHNLNYWTFGDYLAVGAGAHGKLTAADGTVSRYTRPASPRAYMESRRTQERGDPLLPVTGDELVFEYMLNALRLVSGFRIGDFAERTGLPAAMLAGRLEAACAKGLLERPDAGSVRPTALGRRFLNDLQAEFLPP